MSVITQEQITLARVDDGADGEDGYTPQKGIDYFDGEDGQDGQDGQDGADGKTAYESARDGGYTGTEEQFNTDLSDVPNKAKQTDLNDTNEEVSKKSGWEEYYDLIYRLDGGKCATVSVTAGTSFGVNDISINGDIYTKYFEGVSTVSFVYTGTTWNISNDGVLLNDDGHQLDEYGISLSDDVTPVAGDCFSISFLSDVAGLFSRVDGIDNSLAYYGNNTIALMSDVAQVANGLEVYNRSIILNAETSEVKVQSKDLITNINNEVSITPTKIAFRENGNESASISNERLEVNNEYITNYYPKVYNGTRWVGNLCFIARVNGHLSLKALGTNNETISVQEVVG